MKNNIVYTILICAISLVGCDNEVEEETAVVGKSDMELTLNVGISDFNSDLSTRSEEDGAVTKFSSNDVLGLIIEHQDGTSEHVIYTYDGSKWSAPTDKVIYADPTDTYTAYYPYDESMYGKSLDEIRGAHKPFIDQSDYALYARSDLMTCENAVLTGSNLSLTFKHEYSLLRLEYTTSFMIGEEECKFTYSDITLAYFDLNNEKYRAWQDDDKYFRLLVKPDEIGESVTAYVDGARVTAKVSDLEKNKMYSLPISSGTVDVFPTSETVRVGDYYCSYTNGEVYLVPREASRIVKQLEGLTCLGVVFTVGQSEYDKSDYSTTGINQKACHGYVVALKDATSGYCCWGVYDNSDGSKGLGCYPKDEESGNPQDNYNGQDWSGYEYTQLMVAEGQKSTELWGTNEPAGYPAAYYATDHYENDNKAPESSSGWFLPAVGQMSSIYNQRNEVLSGEIATQLFNNWYWSSSEYYSGPGTGALYVRVSYRGNVDTNGKDDSRCYVRPVLAF